MSESSSGFAYRAFISYSHRDKAWADWLHKALETYRVPSRLVGKQTEAGTVPRRLNPVFRDRDELSSAAELGSKINQALGQSENLIVICSPAAAVSRWVNEEVLAFKRLGRTERIFCLIVGGEPDASDMPGREAEECFCHALRFKLDAHGQLTGERTEPIAADTREGKDGKANAKLKLIAGLLGVGFDTLKQRELQRRTRRITAIATLALVVMAATSVLAVYALISRHEAVIAKHKAVLAQTAAVRRQKQAEELVDFMLGDLSVKLEAESRLDILQSVDDKAMAYFQSLPVADVNDQALQQRGAALLQIGWVRRASGQLPGAVEADRAAVKIASRLGSKAPADISRQLSWAHALDELSVDFEELGDHAGQLRNDEAARQVLRRALTHAPSNLDLQQILGDVDQDAGIALRQTGHMDAAAAAFHEELSLERKLVAAKPADIDYETQLGSAHQDLGKLAMLEGDLATTVTEMRAFDAIATRLSQANPKDNPTRWGMAMARGNHAVALALAGDDAAAMRDLQQVTELTRQLAAVDAQNTYYKMFGAYFSVHLARIQRISGEPAAAGKTIGAARAALGDLLGKNPADSQLRLYAAMARAEQAAQSRSGGRAKAARADAQNALHTLEPMLARNPDDRDILMPTVTVKLLLASLEPDAATATTLQEQVLHALQAVPVAKNDPRLLALQVEALLSLNRKATAQPLIKQLWSSGYRDLALVKMLQHEHIDYPINTAFQQRLLAASRQHGTVAASSTANLAHK